ncbi:hypothetical protein OAF16_01095 [Flavobacteriales bacterium]|nr:hypothetical protein [Flavobacteriales bacterium]
MEILNNWLGKLFSNDKEKEIKNLEAEKKEKAVSQKIIEELPEEIGELFDTVYFNPKKAYEKEKIDQYLKEKAAFQKGVKDFETKEIYNPSYLPKDLVINLKREAGSAEVARQNGSLHQYAFHIYRQIEFIFYEMIHSNPGYNKLRKHLYNHSENIKVKQLLKPNKFFHIYKVTYLGSNKFCKSLDGEDIELKKHKHIGYSYQTASAKNITVISNDNKPFNIETKRYIKETDRYVDLLKTTKNYDLSGYYLMPPFYIYDFLKHSISANATIKIFKAAFYFDINTPVNSKDLLLSENYNNLILGKGNSPQLNAFTSLYFYRNLYSHNNKQRQGIEDAFKLGKIKLKPEDQLYLDNHEWILNGDYYQRLLDAVITLYSAYLKDPHF